MRRGTLSAISVGVLALVPQALRTPAPADPVAEDVGDLYLLDAIDRQPILIHDVSGGTLLGPVQSSTVVWSTGDVTFSREDPFTRAEVGSMKLSAEVLAGLVSGIEASGAAELQDQWPQVSDVPLNTVTVLGGETDTSAHTFSYWIAIDDYQAVQGVLDRLMAEVERAN